MIVDASAIVAILLEEPGYREVYLKLLGAERSRFSAASYVEVSMVLVGRYGEHALRKLDRLLLELDLVCVPISVEQAHLAVDAFVKYGKGRHRAGLNFGDCFSYALAKSLGEPLLFKGTDFSQTDVDLA